MKLLKVGALVLSSAMLVACGGEESATQKTTIYQKDGIYYDSSVNRAMLIDESIDGGIWIRSFNSDQTNLFFDSHTTTENTMRFSYAYNTGLNGGEYATGDFPNEVWDFVFSSEGATSYVIDSEGESSLLWSLDRKTGSKTIAELEGSYTSLEDGSEWTIGSDSTLSISGGCDITGQLTMVKDYYYKSSSITATSCTDSEFNGDYAAYAITVNNGTNDMFVLVMSNNDGYIWGDVIID